MKATFFVYSLLSHSCELDNKDEYDIVPRMKSDYRELEKRLKALANRRRLAILRILKTRPKESVGVIADNIKLSFKSTSRHLAVLYAAGIVEREQVSITVYYHLAKKAGNPVDDIFSIL